MTSDKEGMADYEKWYEEKQSGEIQQAEERNRYLDEVDAAEQHLKDVIEGNY